MKSSITQNIASPLRIGGAVLVVAGLATILHPRPVLAANCLYPDKTTLSGPNYSCLKPVEQALVKLREFRAEMTVAALRCEQQNLYNNVVTRHQGELASKGKALGTTFRRLHGTAATHELNRFVTHLTNRASIQSLGIRNYCRSMSDVFAEALKTPLQKLTLFVSSNPLSRAIARNTAPSLKTMPTVTVANKADETSSAAIQKNR